MRVSENRGLRRIFEPTRKEVTEDWRKLREEGFIICTLHHVSLRQ
jgi:regulator of replication initiation timing